MFYAYAIKMLADLDCLISVLVVPDCGYTRFGHINLAQMFQANIIIIGLSCTNIEQIYCFVFYLFS